jgi:hypothetical protein
MEVGVLNDASRCINQCRFPAHDLWFKSKIDLLLFPPCFQHKSISILYGRILHLLLRISL